MQIAAYHFSVPGSCGDDYRLNGVALAPSKGAALARLRADDRVWNGDGVRYEGRWRFKSKTPALDKHGRGVNFWIA